MTGYLTPDLLIIDEFGMRQLRKRSGEFYSNHRRRDRKDVNSPVLKRPFGRLTPFAWPAQFVDNPGITPLNSVGATERTKG